MKITAIQRRNLRKLLPYGMATLMFSTLFLIIEHGLLGDSPVYPSTGNPYDFNSAMLAVMPVGFLMGILLGISEILFLNRIFNNRPFLIKVFVKSFIYISMICLLLFMVAMVINSYQMNMDIWSIEVLESVENFMFSFAFVSIVIYAGACITVVILIAELSDYLGQRTMINYITGKYHRPKQEERIFMFLDMRASTAIAENLGHIRYFEFLNQYYSDLTEFILKSHGEIYQYVGDEVIVSWPVDGINNYSNSIDCFFRIKEGMLLKAEYYDSKYGLRPTFRAGMHSGDVTTGEIGLIKKEIVFTGDVLNTAARIQEFCKIHDREILISSKLRDELTDRRTDVTFLHAGNIKLRGKEHNIDLYWPEKEDP